MHPCVKAPIGFGMGMPESRAHLGERLAMFRTELHDFRHVLGASRSYSEWSGARAKPMLHHVEGDGLIAMALIERSHGSGGRAGRDQTRRACRSQCCLSSKEQ